MPTLFLTIAEVLAIHETQIRRYGGALGLRDFSLLESAVAMPQASFGGNYLHDDLPSMAAAYCFHIVANHPFADGNKRTGAAAASVFLDMNAWNLVAREDQYAEFVLAIASSRLDKQAAIAFFRQHALQASG